MDYRFIAEPDQRRYRDPCFLSHFGDGDGRTALREHCGWMCDSLGSFAENSYGAGAWSISALALASLKKATAFS
jgi:hypothetical protein